MNRFVGTIDKLCDVDVDPYVEMVHSIPSDDWRKLCDPAFMGIGAKFQPLADYLLSLFPGCGTTGIGLWSMEAGHVQAMHKDEQPDNWLVRLHVPIVTNRGVMFTMGGKRFHMEVGSAYRFNTLAEHAVENRGTEARLHFVMDITRR